MRACARAGASSASRAAAGGQPALTHRSFARATRPALPFHQPYARDTAEKLGVEYALTYAVSHINGKHLQPMEQALARAAKLPKSGRHAVPNKPGLRPVFDIEARDVEEQFDEARSRRAAPPTRARAALLSF